MSWSKSPYQLSPEELRDAIAKTGQHRREIARLLGYRSDNSLRQCEQGQGTLPEDKAKWLVRYARLRARHTREVEEWLMENPPPTMGDW